MTHTRFEPTRGEPGLAEGYTPLGLGAAEPSIPEGDGWIGAAGGIWSTPADLMTWDLALMDGKVLNATSWKTMTTPRRADGWPIERVRLRPADCAIAGRCWCCSTAAASAASARATR